MGVTEDMGGVTGAGEGGDDEDMVMTADASTAVNMADVTGAGDDEDMVMTAPITADGDDEDM